VQARSEPGLAAAALMTATGADKIEDDDGYLHAYVGAALVAQALCKYLKE
jgi:hypothetical protein